MNSFISWPGSKSLWVVFVYRERFPSVISSVVSYVLSDDIDKDFLGGSL
jgi:hypothetical protein